MSERQLFELDYSVHKGARGFVAGARNVCMGVLSFMLGAFNLNVRVKVHPFRTGA